LYYSNQNNFGFKNRVLISNSKIQSAFEKNKKQIVFINYDYKNEIECFKNKHNNPHYFPKLLNINVEKEINLNEIQFEKTESLNLKINSTISKEEYIKKINAIKNHIQNGDIYEMNYCITFEAKDVVINPLTVFQKLHSISNAPYAALAKFDKQWIISSSPELFLKKENNKIITKPIKGTAKRGKTLKEDEQIKNELFHNPKERNENVMIVDVARNDLSRIAKKGTVNVEKLFDIESYQQVHQMVSTISCEKKDELTFDEVIKATFPMASMTGAPKIKAMELIDEYELYNRGPYSGSLGVIEANGDFELNVLIRSIFTTKKKNI
jgi:para-aminobenzoate synthetase component 1